MGLSVPQIVTATLLRASQNPDSRIKLHAEIEAWIYKDVSAGKYHQLEIANIAIELAEGQLREHRRLPALLRTNIAALQKKIDDLVQQKYVSITSVENYIACVEANATQQLGVYSACLYAEQATSEGRPTSMFIWKPKKDVRGCQQIQISNSYAAPTLDDHPSYNMFHGRSKTHFSLMMVNIVLKQIHHLIRTTTSHNTQHTTHRVFLVYAWHGSVRTIACVHALSAAGTSP